METDKFFLSDDKILKSREVEIHANSTIADYIFPKLDEFSDGQAVIDASTGKVLTYCELKRSAENVASGLLQAGLRSRQLVAIHSNNVVEFCIAFLGASRAGAIVTTISSNLTTDEIVHQLQSCQPDFLITIFADQAYTALRRFNKQVKVYVIGTDSGQQKWENFHSFDELSIGGDRQLASRAASPEETALILYSSGTTGLPKGVEITHFNMVSNLEQARLGEVFNGKYLDQTLTVFPFYHVGGVLGLLKSIYDGSTLIFSSAKFEPMEFFATIQKYKAVTLFIPPPVALLLAKHPGTGKYNLTTVTTIMIGAAPLGQELSEQLMSRVPSIRDICQGYGMTELSPLCMASGRDGKWKHGSAGYLLPNTQCKVVDVTSGHALGPHTDGEIWIRGPQVMKGYLNNPTATQQTIDKDGFLHTGDIGHFDNDGYFFIVDRLKELIKFNAFQVPPAELEALLLTHPAVADAAVIGVPDEKNGELPRAYIVRKHEHVTAQEIQDFVKGKAAYYKWLRGGVIFVKEIPKSASGKILRRELKAKL